MIFENRAVVKVDKPSTGATVLFGKNIGQQCGNGGNNGNGNGNSGNNGNGNSSSDNNGNANGNTNNTGGSQNQSGILFPETGKVSELEQEMIDMIKTEGKHKNYELIEYVNDVNREHTEVLMELNINGIMDTAYSYGNERLTVERFDGWTGYYTYDPRGSVSGVTGADGYLWQSYRYDAYGNITFGAPQYNNEYTYNAESYNPNLDVQYLRARYYSPSTANFLTEDSYLGDISDPLTLNRYNYVKSSPLNYADPSGHYSSAEGTDAHETLFQYLENKYNTNDKIVYTNYQISGYENSSTGIGKIDIVYVGTDGMEVYELKTINEPFYRWWTKNVKGDLTGPEQRQGYIKALIENGKTVNEEGISLYPAIEGLTLKSKKYPDRDIVYVPDLVNKGMIYWYYKDEKPEERLATKIKKANEKSQQDGCENDDDEVAQVIGEAAGDIAAILLAGYTIKEVIAILSSVLEITLEAAESAFTSFFPPLPKYMYPRPIGPGHEGEVTIS